MNLGGLEELIDNEDFYSLLNVEREVGFYIYVFKLNLNKKTEL